MGCKGSHEANTFHVQLEKKHPVASVLRDRWEAFCKNVRSVTENQTVSAPVVTHESVDAVGKAFLEQVQADMTDRGWGGNFEYNVTGMESTGYIDVTVRTEVSTHGSNGLSVFTCRVNYSVGRPGTQT